MEIFAITKKSGFFRNLNRIRNVQGDKIALADENAKDVAKYYYDAWGNLLKIVDENGNDVTNEETHVGYKNHYRYKGYRYDTETGLYYLQSRYYNSEWGRFINADVVLGEAGELLGHNIFMYCKNNPINMSDSNGYRPVFTVTEEETDDMYKASIEVMATTSPIIYKNNPVKAKAFYTEGEGPKVPFLGKSYGFGPKGDSTAFLGVQVLSGEAGLAKIYGNHKHGNWGIKGPCVNANIGLGISEKPEVSFYGKIALAELSGSIYIPVPFTNKRLELGGAVDVGSAGGGIDFGVRDGKYKLKAGWHWGIGADLIIGID